MATIIDKLDNALQMYYKQLNKEYMNDGVGKFKAFCDENGFEEDDINTEMAMENAEDCVLVDFDEEFPFDIPIDDDDLKNEKIFDILTHCYKKGKPPCNEESTQPNRHHKEPNDIDVENISDEIINEAKDLYKHQLYYSLGDKGIKENDLMYFLAVGYKNNGYPFLTNVVDSFTRDRIVQKYEKKDENNFAFTTAKWVKTNPYTQNLAKKSKRLVNKLESGVVAYCNRISPKIQFTHLYKINDSIREISEYILATIQFIGKLLRIDISDEQALPVAPFQLDLLIAVKNVVDDQHTTKPDFKHNDNDTDDDTDYDDDDDNDMELNQIKDIDVDWIGNIKSKLDEEKCINTEPQPYKINNNNNKNEKDISGPKMRFINGIYTDFRSKLLDRKLSKSDNDGGDNNGDDDDDFKPKVRLPYNASTYPQNKRFCVFVDRRAEKKCEEDEIAIFEPPYVADTIPSKHVSEWYFESVRQCLIPRKGYLDGKNERKVINLANDKNATRQDKENVTITSLTAVAGKLITFSFHVEAEDEIKCYLYWSGQTQRFYPQDIIQILPFIFEVEKDGDKYNNKGFINDGQAEMIIKKMQITDQKFEQFYNKIKTNTQKFPQTTFDNDNDNDK